MQLQQIIIIKSGINVVVRRYGIGVSGKEAQESADIYILMADSHCHMAKKPTQHYEAIILQLKINNDLFIIWTVLDTNIKLIFLVIYILYMVKLFCISVVK